MKTNSSKPVKPIAPWSSIPVSKKAYLGFIDRIDEVFGSNTDGADIMVNCLDLYILGDNSAIDALPPALRLAWEFLRQDVDRAIERSRKARERAKARKALSQAEIRGTEKDIQENSSTYRHENEGTYRQENGSTNRQEDRKRCYINPGRSHSSPV